MNSIDISMDCIYVQDNKNGIVTAFIKQLPNILAEGDSIEEARQSLLNAIHDVFKHQSKEKVKNLDKTIHITQEHIHLKTLDCVCQP
jgi:predicted RNase H-like HicB family nuclease